MAFHSPAPPLLQKPLETPRLRPGPELPGGPREAERPVGSQDGSFCPLRPLHPVREPVPTLPSHFRGHCGAFAAVFGSCVRRGAPPGEQGLPLTRATRTCRMNPSSPLDFSPLKSPENVNHELFFCGEV
ncbi:hypothetical protein EGM_01053, partial [Macaca fascicularis]